MLKQLVRLPLLLLLLCSNTIYAQVNAIAISSFTVKHDLPPNIDKWRTTPAAASMVVENKTWGDRPLLLVIMLKQGDKNICGSDGIELDYFKTRSFQTNDLLQGLKNCESLKTGDYELCVRFRGKGDNGQWVDISPEVCKSFTVGGAGNQKYSGTTLISPANNKVFTEKEASAPITFSCTPIVPKPQEPVIYHFRIWQVAAGQTPMQAMNSSQPVVEKEVENLTQTTITSGLWPCRPNCQFVWRVKATNREGKPYGENGGESEVSLFSVASSDITITNFNIACGSIFGSYTFSLTSTNYGNNQFSLLSNTPITFTSSAGTISGIVINPSPGNAIINSNGSSTFTGSFSYSGTYPAAVIAKVSGAQTGNPNLTSTDTEVDSVRACKCTFCDNVQWQISDGQPTWDAVSSSITLNQGINIPGVNIKSFKAEIISFTYNSDNEECMLCNKNSNTFGNFNDGLLTTPAWGAIHGVPGIIPGGGITHHTLNWFTASVSATTIGGSLILNISSPPFSALSCCDDNISFCIRYTFTDDKCQTCSIVKCYNLTRKHIQR